MNIRICLVAASVVTLVGCGGIVNYTPDGGEGGSGAMGGGGSGPNGPNGPNGPSNSNSNSNSMDVVSTGPQTTCELFCGEFQQCIGGDECFDACNSFYMAGCEAQAEVYLQCLITDAPSDCSFPEGLCATQLANYNQCVNQSACFTEDCTNGGQDCQCFGECNGFKVEQYCWVAFDGGGGGDATGTSVGTGAGGGGEAPPPQEYQCDCYLDGNYAGNCFDEFDACSLEQGCCQQYTFGVDG